eukprot:6200901-Pleurochrysis_carterae.AAC.4
MSEVLGYSSALGCCALHPGEFQALVRRPRLRGNITIEPAGHERFLKYLKSVHKISAPPPCRTRLPPRGSACRQGAAARTSAPLEDFH